MPGSHIMLALVTAKYESVTFVEVSFPLTNSRGICHLAVCSIQSHHRFSLCACVATSSVPCRCVTSYLATSTTTTGLLKQKQAQPQCKTSDYQDSHFFRLTKFHDFSSFFKVNFQVFFHFLKIWFPSCFNYKSENLPSLIWTKKLLCQLHSKLINFPSSLFQ